MPRASRPSQPEVHIRFAERDGVRNEDWAIDFLCLYRDQFGTIILAYSDDDLIRYLHPLARQNMALLHESDDDDA